ncbi:sensor histidine kinase [Saccharicrinis sp. FJH2]|uniref:sensor histidine kinase n=1 Tax=Saccharicrinis sp. FJH65 TaxID=3344659 RepID=UPI0035F34C2D
MKNSSIKYVELTVHSLCWIGATFLFIHFNALTFHYLNGNLMDVPIILGTFINIVLFYLNLLYLFPKFKSGKLSLIGYVSLISVTLIILSVLENAFDFLFAKQILPDIRVVPQTGEIIVTSLINLSFMVLSILYAIIKDWINNEIVKRKLAEENLRLELNYLKSQISPHFLFNSLNNLFSVALKNNDSETASGLAKLSTLMRFMLDKSDKSIVKLTEEIEYLKSYIELQKLRFMEDDNIEVSFKTTGDPRQFNIPPFLLINFVENAFKHGIDYKKSSKINILISIVNDVLNFTVENTNHTSKKGEAKKKIGLINVKKRLDLIYRNNYDLIIESDKQTYSVKLKIKSL